MNRSTAAAPAAPTNGMTRGRPNADALFAGLVVLLVGLQRGVILGATVGTIVAVAATPLWWRSTARFSGARAFFIAAVLAIIGGAWLTETGSVDHQTSTKLELTGLLIIVNIAVGVGVLLWARLRMPAANVALLYGAGMLLSFSPGPRYAENPWRFGFSIPLTFLALALAWRIGKRWLEFAVTLFFAAATGLSGGRSTFAMLLLTAVLVAWQVTAARTRTGGRARVVLFVVGIAFGVFQIGQGLILDGYLGMDTQQRTQAQVDAGGNVLLGGRPEIGATIALMGERPFGFGAGTLPNPADINVAKQGMSRIGYNPNNGYVTNYMFGQSFTLHSVIGDTWVRYGLLGAGFGLMTVVASTGSVTGLITRRAGPALLIFLAINMVWNAFFSPIHSSIPTLIAALGLILPLRSEAPPPRSAAALPARRDETP